MTANPPFSELIHALGRGPSRSRSLTMAEAEAAMTMICTGQAEPVQVGALLVLLRYRGESPAELAGLVQALRATVPVPSSGAGASGAGAVDLDWPTYAAGRSRGLPWFVLSALLLAAHGVRVLMHGHTSHQSHPVSPQVALAALGIMAATSVDEAAERVARDRFAYAPLAVVCPKLLELIELRRLLGIRSVANTAARMLNPLAAPHLIQGVFHPPYRTLQQQAALLLGQPHLAVFKGGGGEAERPPGKAIEVLRVDQNQTSTTLWPPLPGDDGSHSGEPAMTPDPLVALWRGERTDPRAEAVVIGTAAVALHLLGRAATPNEADAMAATWWQTRPTPK